MDKYDISAISFIKGSEAHYIYKNAKDAKKKRELMDKINRINKKINLAVNSEPPEFRISAEISRDIIFIITILGNKGYSITEKPNDYAVYYISWDENSKVSDESKYADDWYNDVSDTIPDAPSVYCECIKNKEFQSKKYIFETLTDISNKIKEQLKKWPYINSIDRYVIKLSAHKDIIKLLGINGYAVHSCFKDEKEQTIEIEISW